MNSTVEDKLHRSWLVVDRGHKSILFVDAVTHEVSTAVFIDDAYCNGICMVHPRSLTGRDAAAAGGGGGGDVQVAVSSSSSHSVKVFDMTSKELVRSIGQGDRRGPGFLSSPTFICMFHPSGAGSLSASVLLVNNSGHYCIDAFDFDSGSYIRSIGYGIGEDPGQLNSPGAIAVWTPQEDPTNAQVVVADRGNHRIQFFRISDGSYVRSVSDAAGRISFPFALAIHQPAGGLDEEALLVTIGYMDSLIHVLSVVSGEYLRCLGGGVGEGVDQMCQCMYGMTFHRPAGEAEAETQVIVSDVDGNKLQLFNLYTGAHICSIGGRDSGLIKYPMCITSVESTSDDWRYVLK